MTALILGVKKPFPKSLRRAEIKGQTVPHDGVTLYHLADTYRTIGEATQAYHELYRQVAADTALRDFSGAAIERSVYVPDPPCVVPKACEGPCRELCADDQWSTAQYHSHLCKLGVTCDRVREDCDGQTLLGAPRLGGRPLFCDGGDQLHVLSLPEETRAVDLSVRAGMRPFKGRDCFWYDDAGKPVKGRMVGPQVDDRGTLSIFRIERV